MKIIRILVIICLCSNYMLSQEKWGSYDGNIAGTFFSIIEACGDSIEVSSGQWYEKMQLKLFGFTHENAGRQIIGDSVFFKFNLLDNSAPILLYDYSVEVGDTINGSWGEFIVTEVDTEFAVGKERKRITMESSYDGHIDIWLSGLGSKVSGYLQPGSPLFAPDAGSEFSCYLDELSGEYYYGDKDPLLCMIFPTGSACVTTSVIDKEFVDQIKIFPNPTNGLITIEIDNDKNKQINAQLLSFDGKLIINKKYISDNLTLDVSSLMPGIYILEVSQNGNKSNHKIIIQ